ncbi:hypothetical protein LG634_07330 [Streptomyces bambusae]|uniref:hypothetical protein n=1 Tax=Streptomyces bambusae TaxID=1550616 RepID=UPI001CFC4AE4|nr:hypothetical protein [Streptomyces bambusae]MCB5164644.1 hypothetical protein [Streptomyces bambusae]
MTTQVVVSELASTNTEGSTTRTALCPAGRRITGGGYVFTGTVVGPVYANHADPVANGWTVTVGSVQGQQATFQAHAVCAD